MPVYCAGMCERLHNRNGEMMRLTIKQKKAKLIRLVHVAKNQLMLNDSEYRKIIASCACGKTSSKELSIAELELVMRSMKSHGFIVTINNKNHSQQQKIYANDPQSKMIRGLWIELYEMGEVNDNSEMALAKFTKRMTGVDHYAFLDSDRASQLIEHLKAWRKRKEIKNGR